jgi:hypothetical protein
MPEFVRLTIDSSGIKSIERLHQAPNFSPEPSLTHAFIVQNGTKLHDVQLQLKVKVLFPLT